MFTEAQKQQLDDVLDRDRVKPRQGANGETLHYVEGWDVIEAANAIFGFGNWSRETVMIEPLHDPTLIPDERTPTKNKVVASYFAKVRVTVYSEDHSKQVVREGCGAARNFAKTAGEAMEQAIKSAETDATKRALVTFGNAFGLALYDKAKRNVGKPEARAQVANGHTNGHEPAAIDAGFEPVAAPRQTTSQRALAVSRRARGASPGASPMTADIGDCPV